MEKKIIILSILIILFSITTSSVGLFFNDGGVAFYVENVVGDTVKIFGNGLYAHDSYFKAPIYKGTDAIILFLIIPLFIITVFLHSKDLIAMRLLHLGLVVVLLYYSISLAMGAAYNILFLVYILLFSACLFAVIIGICNLAYSRITEDAIRAMPNKSIAAFLFVAGLSVFVWFIEIIEALLTGSPPSLLGISTTEPTFVLDIGIIAPVAFYSAWLVYKRKPFGYILAIMLLTLNSAIGLIVISQSAFQYYYGVMVSLQELIAYVAVFVVMSSIAFVLNYIILKNIQMYSSTI